MANLDYCSRETGLSRGFAHYEDYPLWLSDIFTRYVGLVSRLDLLTPASVLNRLLNENGRASYDLTPLEGTRKECRRGKQGFSRLAFVATPA